MLNVFFSIIIPVYNAEKYLSRCLDSVVNQSFKDIEIIIVNDGSTDMSADIIEEYARKDSRIKLIDQENKGQGYARNIGINSGRGDYIIFVDSDDYVELDMCEKFYDILQNKKIEVLINPFFFVKKSNKKLFGDYFIKFLPQEKIFDAKTGTLSILKAFKNNFFITTIAHFVFKTSYLKEKKIYFPEKILYEDVIFCTDAFLQAEKIYVSKICKYHYNLTPVSTMRGKASLEKKIHSANSYYLLAHLLYQRIKDYEDVSLKKILKISSETAIFFTLRAIQKTGYHPSLVFTKNDLLNFDCHLSILKKINLHHPVFYRFLFPFVLCAKTGRIVLYQVSRMFYAILFPHHTRS